MAMEKDANNGIRFIGNGIIIWKYKSERERDEQYESLLGSM